MSMRLSKLERETIISFNEAESTAYVYTCNTAIKNRLAELSLKNSDIYRVKEDKYSQTYIIPKKIIKFNLPRKLSEEKRKKAAIRLQQNIEKYNTQKNFEKKVI